MTEINIPFDPNNFHGGPITNPFLPLTPGNSWVYQDVEGGVVTDVVDTVTVTNQTKVIDGVECVVVKDVVREGNKITESTKDYYAQDVAGNVWYFAEDTKTFQAGGVDRAGTFRGDVDGAAPGIIMLAHPQIGDRYFEENAPGVAVDQAEVTSLNQSANVPFGSFQNCLQTRNTSAIIPGDIEFKFYQSGIGSVLETSGDTRTELVSFTSGGHNSLVQSMAGFGAQGQVGTASLPQKPEHAQLADIVAPHQSHHV